MEEEDYNLSLSQDQSSFETQAALMNIQADIYVILQTQAHILAKLNNTDPAEEMKKLEESSKRKYMKIVRSLYKRYGANVPPESSDV